MIISVTTGKYPTSEQSQQSQAFLETFLPRMRQFPAVHAIYHYTRPEHGEGNTLVIWESQVALLKYRESGPVKRAMAFEKQMGAPATRVYYPLDIAL
jgi:hypothetical protein